MNLPLEKCSFVIFGATGNLARSKLMPALYHLEAAGLLPEGMKIIGLGRRIDSLEAWRKELYQDIKPRARGGLCEETFKTFSSRLEYLAISLKDEQSYTQLADFLRQDGFPANMAFYFSLPPSLYGGVATQLGRSGLLNQDRGWRRVVVEKPFGYDLSSAQALQQQFDQYLDEAQIYRIDHYLGKETVQNLQVFRFANIMLEPLWNRNYIDHVQITHAETIGIGDRGGYYDQTGALRDMIQSHLLQMLSLVAMEPPISMQAEDLRNEKVKLLRAVSPLTADNIDQQVCRGQYEAGEIQGKPVNAYREEAGIPTQSNTETYTAVKLHIDNWRWQGVPFYLRTGKRMGAKTSLIAICFKQPPKQFFKTSQSGQFKPNWLLMGIQPDESLRMELMVKKPGLEMQTQSISLDTCLHNGDTRDAYEGLLLDVIEGDHSLFLRSDEVQQSWKIVDPILKYWQASDAPVSSYPTGSWGPEQASQLFERPDQSWRSTVDPDEA